MIVEEEDISGLFYINNVDLDTKQTVTDLDKLTWNKLSDSKNSRMVQQYGYEYNYTTRSIGEKTADIPVFLKLYADLLTDVCSQLKIIEPLYTFNQCIVNNYYSGQGISPHIDLKYYGGVIGCFTLGSGATMVFEKGNEKHDLYVRPNSLYIMSEDARWSWKHSMTMRKSDTVDGKEIARDRRVSITFRHV